MDEPLDMRDELEQDWGDDEEAGEEDDLKKSGMHVEGEEEDDEPIEIERE